MDQIIINSNELKQIETNCELYQMNPTINHIAMTDVPIYRNISIFSIINIIFSSWR